MKCFLLIIFSIVPFLSWGSCDDINYLAEKERYTIPSSESGYIVSDAHKVYFFSAPDDNCKIKELFIVNGDLVDAYADYKEFSYVMYFKKNGDVVKGWIHSKSIKPTGTGIGPKS